MSLLLTIRGLAHAQYGDLETAAVLAETLRRRDEHISPHTVRTHLRRIFERLGLRSRTELVRLVLVPQERKGQRVS